MEKVACDGCGNEYKKTKSGKPYAHKCVPKPAAQPVVPADVDETTGEQEAGAPVASMAEILGASPTTAQNLEMEARRAGGAEYEAARLTALLGSQTATRDPFAAPEPQAARPGPEQPASCNCDPVRSNPYPGQAVEYLHAAGCPLVGGPDEAQEREKLMLLRARETDTPAANWNGTGRPKPSAATVQLPEQSAPQPQGPRLLEALANGMQQMNGSVTQAAQSAVRSAQNATQDAYGLAPAQPVEYSSPADVMAFLGGGTPAPKGLVGPEGPAAPKGPWTPAQFASTALDCGHDVEAGDEIRADGEGGWECRLLCEDPLGETESHEIQRRADYAARSAQQSSAADVNAFLGLAPAPAAPQAPQQSSAADVMAFLNNSPVPDALRNADGKPVPFDGSMPDANRAHTNRDGYTIRQPDTGDFRRYKAGHVKGITRCTTHIKAASDSTALKDWAKRNVLVGASRRPDLVMQAHNLDVREDSGRLNDLVEELEAAAGAKVSADVGTAVHNLTEKLDAGLITMDQVPPLYRAHVQSYVNALRDNGLEVVPSLIEGTIYVPEWGGVAGKFDRVLYHRASNTYRMADLKTGRDMSYGWDEIEAQEYVYTSGYNRFGTYDWSTDTWTPPAVQVATDYGIVMHLPVQEGGPTPVGKCVLLRTDLERGGRHAELCGKVREGRKAKGTPEAWVPPARDWESSFAGVSSMEEAGALWDLAASEGVAPERLSALVGIAQTALTPAVRDWAAEFRSVPDMASAGRLWAEAQDAGLGPTVLSGLVDIAQNALHAKGLTV